MHELEVLFVCLFFKFSFFFFFSSCHSEGSGKKAKIQTCTVTGYSLKMPVLYGVNTTTQAMRRDEKKTQNQPKKKREINFVFNGLISI